MGVDEVHELYHDVDKKVAALVAHHHGRLHCDKGCAGCCCDDLTVFGVEAENIRTRHPGLLATGVPFAEGHCAFLDADNNCRIYPDRPYVCRTQGLPLHWVVEGEDGNLVAYRDICPENETVIPVTELDERECWVIGPFEERLMLLQYDIDGGALRRIPLRSLFARRDSVL